LYRADDRSKSNLISTVEQSSYVAAQKKVSAKSLYYTIYYSPINSRYEKKVLFPQGIDRFDAVITRMDTHMFLKGSAWATRQNYLSGLKVLIEYYQRVPEEW